MCTSTALKHSVANHQSTQMSKKSISIFQCRRLISPLTTTPLSIFCVPKHRSWHLSLFSMLSPLSLSWVDPSPAKERAPIFNSCNQRHTTKIENDQLGCSSSSSQVEWLDQIALFSVGGEEAATKSPGGKKGFRPCERERRVQNQRLIPNLN